MINIYSKSASSGQLSDNNYKYYKNKMNLKSVLYRELCN